MAAAIRIVGRESEIAALRGVVDAMPEGAVVVIDGEPGLGKSTLIDVACARAEAAGAAVVRVSADEFSMARPLGLLPDGAHGSGADPDALLEYLDRIAAGRPCMLTFDDLQWADPASLTLLGPLARRAVAAGVVVVLAHRRWPASPALDDLLDRLDTLQPVLLSLRPMSTAEVRVLGELQVGRPLGAGVRSLLDQAGGNPFYALSMMKMLAAEGALDSKLGVAELVGPVPAVDRSSLGALVMRRVALLGPEAEHVLQHAAVLGRSFGVTLLADLVERPTSEVSTLITRAVRAEVLREDGPLLSFRHDLLRDALSASLPGASRAVVHRRAATLTEAAGDLAAAASHALDAELTAADVGWLQSLVGMCSPTTGLALLERALALAPASDPRVGAMEVARVDLLLWNGRPSEACEVARTLLATELVDAVRVELNATVAHALFLLGRPAEAVDSWLRFPESADPVVRAVELAELAFACMFAGRLHQARSWAGEALALAVDDDTSVTIASLVLAYVTAAAGEVTTARTHADTAVARAAASGETGRRIGPRLIRAAVRDYTCDTAGAIDDLMADEAEPMDQVAVVRVPFRLSVLATAHFRAGRWDDALAACEAGAIAAHDLQVGVMDGWLCALPMLITLHRHGAVAAAALPAPSSSSQMGTDWMMWAQGLTSEANGDVAGAFELLEMVANVAAAIGSGASTMLVAPDAVRLAMALGRSENAAALVQLCAWAEGRYLAPAGCEFDWVRGLWQQDVEAVTAAASKLESVRPFQAARAWSDAALLLATTDTSAARDAAGCSLRLWGALGADDAAARLRAALRAHGVRVHTGRPAAARVGWESVTATERMVVELVMSGCSNAEVATRLHMNRRTVESHLAHVYTKVGARSRVALAREASGRWGHS